MVLLKVSGYTQLKKVIILTVYLKKFVFAHIIKARLSYLRKERPPLQKEATYEEMPILPQQFACVSLCLQIWMWVLTASNSQGFNSIILQVRIRGAIQSHLLSYHPSLAIGKS